MKKLILLIAIIFIGISAIAQKPIDCPSFGRKKSQGLRHLIMNIKPPARQKQERSRAGESVIYYSIPDETSTPGSGSEPAETAIDFYTELKEEIEVIPVNETQSDYIEESILPYDRISQPVLASDLKPLSKGKSFTVELTEIEADPARFRSRESIAVTGELNYAMPTQSKRYNRMAVAGFVVALSGIFLFWTFPIGALLSAFALDKISRTGEQGRGLALAGLIIGIAGTLSIAAFLVWFYFNF